MTTVETTIPYRVLGARAIIRMDPVQNKTLGGIIIQSDNIEPSRTGTVMVTGPGQRLDNGSLFPMSVRVGDRVIIQDNAGVPVGVQGDPAEYLVVNEGHIIAVQN